ncbi:MAG TPA: hypothetical protein DGQ38_04590 [Zunongwangia profunda]|jgi:hypothetical protein|uniref:Uncharacterized protein n=1 Tax=Zunongwangia profunda TaxID=398743 RepID=A0A3D5IX19_9FLAO|nr:hypothetical protein [Flavobacteriaceae bacterium]HCV80307.1 hypothetical protein [Zunongwangia profunda]
MRGFFLPYYPTIHRLKNLNTNKNRDIILSNETLFKSINTISLKLNSKGVLTVKLALNTCIPFLILVHSL